MAVYGSEKRPGTARPRQRCPGNAFPSAANAQRRGRQVSRGGAPKRGGGAFPEIISTLGLLSMLTAYLQAEKRRGQEMRQFVRQRQKNQLAQ